MSEQPATGEWRRRAAECGELPFLPAEEPLELLLPDASAEQRGRALRVTSFLRLLSADARGRGAERTQADLEHASVELVRQARALQLELLEDLLHHHLRAHVGGESFAWYGDAARSARDAWSLVESSRAELEGLPELPAPGETALEVAARLVEAFERVDVRRELDATSGERAGLARARFVHAAQGPSNGAQHFEALLEREPSPPLRAAALAGLVECFLDRGAVRDALLRLDEQGLFVRADRRLARLALWARVASGDLAAARRMAESAGAWDGLLPQALVELRDELPDALVCLSGRAHLHAPRSTFALADPAHERRELGASFVAVLRFGADRVARALRVEAAPGLRAGVASWLRDREGACAVASEPEHRLVLGARAVRLHRSGDAPLPGALGRDGARALVLAPILADGEVEGWIHVECEHHLLPSARRLDAWTEAWRARLERERICVSCAASREAPRPALAADARDGGEASFLGRALDEPARGIVAEAFAALVAALGFKTQTRAWWGIDVARGAARVASAGGEGLELAPRPAGHARAVARCVATGGAACFDEADPRLSIHPRAASGVVLPLCVRGEVCGLLAIESARRRDFRAADLARFEELARPFALALRVAQFRGWHLARFGFDVFLDASTPGFRSWADELVAAARSRAPLLLAGERGVGKSVLARWAHFESGRADDPLRTMDPASQATSNGFDAFERGELGGSLLLEELCAAPRELQLDLARALERAEREQAAQDARPRILATSSTSLAEALASGHLRHDLAARFERLELFVPPLRDRREEIPGLARFFAARFAAEERERAPSFGDDALALLWRQPWEGNLRQLEAFVFKLVLLRPGAELGPDALEEVARRFRVPLVARLASRHPRRRDLAAALRSTRLGSERINKRRAAAHLGWDPDTLLARLAEAHLDNDTLEREPGPWEPSAGDGERIEARAATDAG